MRASRAAQDILDIALTFHGSVPTLVPVARGRGATVKEECKGHGTFLGTVLVLVLVLVPVVFLLLAAAAAAAAGAAIDAFMVAVTMATLICRVVRSKTLFVAQQAVHVQGYGGHLALQSIVRFRLDMSKRLDAHTALMHAPHRYSSHVLDREEFPQYGNRVFQDDVLLWFPRRPPEYKFAQLFEIPRLKCVCMCMNKSDYVYKNICGADVVQAVGSGPRSWIRPAQLDQARAVGSGPRCNSKYGGS